MEENKEVKKTAPRKPRTTKPKEEEQQLDLQAQMAAMMQMMMQQQQQIMELMARQQEVEEVKEEEPQQERKQCRVRPSEKTNISGKVTKQQLRRKYKETDIYITSVTNMIVTYQGKKEMYKWEQKDECLSITIDDLLAMSEEYLFTPWLILDDYENEPEVLDDIIECLGLESMYEHLYLLIDIEENINKVDTERVKQIISSPRGRGLIVEISGIVQGKILDGTLTNMKVIKEYEKILHKNFKKE